MLRITAAQILHDHIVTLILSNGDVIQRDLSPLLTGPAFERIRDDANLFRQLTVDGGTIVWPSGADLCPDVIIWGGLPPADASTRAA